MLSSTLQRAVALAFFVSCVGCAGNSSVRTTENSAAAVQVGPARGTLIVIGGGVIGPDIFLRFIAAAGGRNANIVVIPTAGEEETFPSDWVGFLPFRLAGASSVKVLHTRDPGVADTEAFVKPLRSATGVFIMGGRQWRLADAYLNTRTLQELNKVLERGGVIAGTSAGASVQASYMVRGARDANTIMMAPGYEQGFGFLRNAAVDQHLSARNRQRDLVDVVQRYQNLLGIGLDESTAIVVRGDTADIIGQNRVAFYNTDPAQRTKFFWLRPGNRFDLNRRTVIKGIPIAGN